MWKTYFNCKYFILHFNRVFLERGNYILLKINWAIEPYIRTLCLNTTEGYRFLVQHKNLKAFKDLPKFETEKMNTQNSVKFVLKLLNMRLSIATISSDFLVSFFMVWKMIFSFLFRSKLKILSKKFNSQSYIIGVSKQLKKADLISNQNMKKTNSKKWIFETERKRRSSRLLSFESDIEKMKMNVNDVLLTLSVGITSLIHEQTNLIDQVDDNFDIIKASAKKTSANVSRKYTLLTRKISLKILTAINILITIILILIFLFY